MFAIISVFFLFSITSFQHASFPYSFSMSIARTTFSSKPKSARIAANSSAVSGKLTPWKQPANSSFVISEFSLRQKVSRMIPWAMTNCENLSYSFGTYAFAAQESTSTFGLRL